jgi:hypothetical protein
MSLRSCGLRIRGCSSFAAAVSAAFDEDGTGFSSCLGNNRLTMSIAPRPVAFEQPLRDGRTIRCFVNR